MSDYRESSDSANDMERIRRGLEEFLQQEMAKESACRQDGTAVQHPRQEQTEPQFYTIEEEDETEKEIDIIGTNRSGRARQSTRREVYEEDWDSKESRPNARSGSGRGGKQSGRSQSGKSQNSRNQSGNGQNSRGQNGKSQSRNSQNSRGQNSKSQSGNGQNSRSQNVKGQNGRSQNSKSQNSRNQNGRGQNSGSKKKKSRLKGFLITILLLAALLAAGLYYIVGRVYSRMNYREIESVVKAPMQEDGVVNILLIGNDSRENGEDGRSDAMILLSVSSKTKKIYMTSLLRDMYVEIPGHDGNRLNAAYSFGGAELLMETVEKNLGITVNRYVLVNFEAFAKLVDAVGGVDLELSTAELELVNGYLNEYNMLTGRPIDTDYMDTTAEGMVHLNGPQALAYTRNRYIGTDFGRTERQRKVLTEVIHGLPKAVLTNPKELIDGLMPNLTTNLTQWECYRLSLMAPKLLAYDIEQGSVPLEGTYKNASIRGMAVLEVDFEANREYLQKMLFEPREEDAEKSGDAETE